MKNPHKNPMTIELKIATAEPPARRFTKVIRSAGPANKALAAVKAAGLRAIGHDEPLGPGEYKAHVWRSCSTGEFAQLDLAYGHTRRLV